MGDTHSEALSIVYWSLSIIEQLTGLFFPACNGQWVVDNEQLLGRLHLKTATCLAKRMTSWQLIGHFQTMNKAKKSNVAESLTDDLLESGADLSKLLHNPRAVPAMLDSQKVNVDFPAWVVQELDREASRIGVPRQSLIKLWIVEHLERKQQSA